MSSQKKTGPDPNWHKYYLRNILNNHIKNKLHTEKNIHWIMGSSAVLLGLTFPKIIDKGLGAGPGIVIMSAGSLVSFLITLYAFEPLGLFTKPAEHKKKSLMYYKSFKDMTPEELAQSFASIDSYEKQIQEYANTLKNMVDRQLVPKNKLLKASTWVLMVSVLLGGIIILYNLFL